MGGREGEGLDTPKILYEVPRNIWGEASMILANQDDKDSRDCISLGRNLKDSPDFFKTDSKFFEVLSPSGKGC